MVVQQAAMREKPSGNPAGPGDPAQRSLLSQPAPFVAYVTAVVAYDLALIGWGLARTPLRPSGMLLFLALLTCGAICVEATRRLGASAGVSRDLLFVWWLPIALLLPPVYALVAPIPLGALLQWRVQRDFIYRRMLSMAALSVSGAAASVTFGHSSVRAGAVRELAVRLSYPGHEAGSIWPLTLLIAVGCAALFWMLNTALMAVAAQAAQPLAEWRVVFWDGENLILDLTGVCVGVVITAVCALSPVLLVVMLPPVILLQRSLLHQQLRAAARTDAKTGLLNAAAWQRDADTEISRVARTRDSLALLLVDIDHFKRVNDTYGHLSGDQVLAGLAEALRQRARARDVIGRFGGEEFVVLLPGAGAAEACQAAERLRKQIGATPIACDAGLVQVTVSVGVAVLGRHGDDIPGLLATADLALYQAKAAGRNQVCLFGSRGGVVPRPR
jgi:diguanylate cyclase (GGDEF)-like protein